MSNRPRLEVADVLRRHGRLFRATRCVSQHERRVMRDLEQCRTAALGGHVEACDHCGDARVAYNSCRNRHCPKCQSLAKARWLEARLAELLPVQYFHVVFTLPSALRPLALANRRLVYDTLFAATAETLRTLAADPKHLGGEIAFVAVLHTWGQNLELHPHLHCVVPGGAIAEEGRRWIACRPGFFLPVRVLSRLFRRLFLERLAKSHRAGDLRIPQALAEPGRLRALLDELAGCEWVVYAKRPFAGPRQVLDYLGQYTHRVAISNHRLLDLAHGRVTFRWRDYRHGSRQRAMTLDVEEFIRRFLLHTLPPGFVRIRHYGFLANRHRATKLELARRLLGAEPEPEAQASTGDGTRADWKALFEKLTGRDPLRCPSCGEGTLVLVQALAPRPPPLRDISYPSTLLSS